MKKQHAILMIGNFLSKHSLSRNVCEDLAERLMESGWKVITTSDKPYRLLRLFDILFTILSRGNEYEIAQVDVYSGPAFLLQEVTCWALRVARKPYILTLHGGNLPEFAKRWPARVRRLFLGASIITCPSLYLHEQMQLYSRNIVMVPNPLNLSTYGFRKRDQVRSSMVWLRSFHKIYNPALGIKVVALLISEFPDLTLTMIGPDKWDGTLQETQAVIEKFNLQKIIEIVPGIPKSKVPEYLGWADVFINTTNIDNTPVSVLEAMASGLCIVSTNVGGIPYLLEDEKDALLVPPNDPEAMASAIRRIFTEIGLSAKLSMNARKKAGQFDWSVILPLWENLFLKISGN